jgi:hypothetical protein
MVSWPMWSSGLKGASSTFSTATAADKVLEDLGIVTELTGQRSNRSYSHAMSTLLCWLNRNFERSLQQLPETAEKNKHQSR